MGKISDFFSKFNNFIDSENNKREEAQAKYEFDSAVMDFEIKFERSIERWNDRIDNAIETSDEDPDKNVKAYQKAISLCNDFKEFCYSHGDVGSSYYDNNESHLIKNIQQDLDNYLANDYKEEKQEFDEIKFEKRFRKTIDNWNNKINNVEDIKSNDPDKIVNAYKKAINFCNEFKEFCYSHGDGGSSYYDNNESYQIKDLTETLNNYLSDNYESEQKTFKKEQKLFNDTKQKVYELISSNHEIRRTELLSNFDDELKSLITKVSNELISEGNINQEKINGRIWFKTTNN